MYILDAGNARLQRWIIGMSYGITLITGSMTNPNGMKWDFSNNLFVADTGSHRIIAFYVLCRK